MTSLHEDYDQARHKLDLAEQRARKFLTILLVTVLAVTLTFGIIGAVQQAQVHKTTTNTLQYLIHIEQESAKQTPKSIAAVEEQIVKCILDQDAVASKLPLPYKPIPPNCPTASIIVK